MQVPNDVYLRALAAAAQAKGRPLTDAERIAVHKDCLRETYRQRFLAVIRGAGYREGAPESICNEWLDKYMADIPAFERMLVTYETNPE